MIPLKPPGNKRMMDRWMRKREEMMRNTVAAKLGWDITIDFIVIKRGHRDSSNERETGNGFGGATTLARRVLAVDL